MKRKSSAAEKLISVPEKEYKFLKEMYKTVKRQKFLFRLEEAEENLKKGHVKTVKIDDFIKNI